MVTIDEVIAHLIAEGVAVTVRPREGARVGGSGSLILHLDPNRRLAAELTAAAPGRVCQVGARLRVVERFREIGDWLLDHPEPAVAARLAVMVPQVMHGTRDHRPGEWPPAAGGPHPALPVGPLPTGGCLACGEPLPPGGMEVGGRCRPCRMATQLAFARVLEGVATYEA